MSEKMSNLAILCRLCNKPIKFDDKRVSLRSGKKIPLDVYTNEPHDCPVWKGSQRYQSQSQPQTQPQEQTQRRYAQCRKGCGNEIYFDANNKSQSGKFIPLDKDTGMPHQCP